MVWKALGAGAALTLAQVIVGMAVPIQAPPSPGMFGWLLVSNLATAGVLTWIAAKADERGWKLALALSGIPFGIAMLNNVEGLVFLGNSGIDWTRITLSTALVWALLIPVWKFLFGRRPAVVPIHESPLKNHSSWGRVWRFLLSDVSYLILYFTAGTIIFPFVREYYSTQTVPPPGRLILLQLALRGPVFVGICLLLMRLTGFPRTTGALAVGLGFTILSGVAPLIFPNPYFPDAVRRVHLCEISASNFLFGVLVAWIWGKSKAESVLVPARCHP